MEREGARELLYCMVDASEDGCAALVQYIIRHFVPHSLDLELELLKYCMKRDSATVGSVYDSLFMNLQRSQAVMMESFFDEFFLSPSCKYCRHYVYAFLKDYCDFDAERALLWLTLLYESKKNGKDVMDYNELTDVLLLSYNRILNTDKHSKTLEDAMNLLDDMLLLEDNNMVPQLTEKLSYE